MKIVPLTRDIFHRVSGIYPLVTVKGLAVVDDNNAYGLVAITLINGEKFIICDIEGPCSKRIIIKVWALFKSKYMADKGDYYAILDDELSTAKGFCRHFGFIFLKDNIYIHRV